VPRLPVTLLPIVAVLCLRRKLLPALIMFRHVVQATTMPPLLVISKGPASPLLQLPLLQLPLPF
jgi:hypothetical protein